MMQNSLDMMVAEHVDVQKLEVHVQVQQQQRLQA